ncbi:hypothetical protein RRG08_004518 [Elysia crispata]|uniref:Uncharacterized protein n=1 Tax=Elysia crispata TaxID=231223 RepID=A0AAE1EDS1_9GAST|nr:hypothetical protein RRG08_004518 [Elysia crispata]
MRLLCGCSSFPLAATVERFSEGVGADHKTLPSEFAFQSIDSMLIKIVTDRKLHVPSQETGQNNLFCSVHKLSRLSDMYQLIRGSPGGDSGNDPVSVWFCLEQSVSSG